MMLDRLSWSLLGASLLVACAADSPESRPSAGEFSSGVESDRERTTRVAPPGAVASGTDAASRAKAKPPPGSVSGASVPTEPRTWAESLDAFVFGPDARDPETRGEESPARKRASADDVQELRLAGIRALEEGRTEDAFEKFRSAHARAPAAEKWQYLRLMANIRTGMRRDQEALDLYLQLIEVQPEAARRDATVHGNLALLYYRLDRLPEAREAVKRALELEPAFPEALRTLGLIEIKEGRLEVGVDLLEKAVALKRLIPEAQVALAEYEESVGRREEAAARYRYLLEVMKSADFRDPLERWRNLFGTSNRSTADEFRRRVQRLESSGENADNARG